MGRLLRIGCVVALTALFVFEPGIVRAACPQGAPEPLILKSASEISFIGDHAAVLADPAGRLDYEDARRADRAGRFAPHCRAYFDPPGAEGALWVRLDVRRAEEAPAAWAVAFGEIEIDEVRLYRALPEDLFVLKRTGRAVPASARDAVSRWPAFELRFAPQETVRLYLRLSGIGAPFVSAKILPLKDHIDQNGRDLLMLAAVLGFIVAMLVYNLVIYVRSRLHQCLYYFLYLGFIIGNIVVYDGLIYRFADFTLSGRAADVLSQSLGVAAGVSLLLFGRSLLELPEKAPAASRMSLWIAAAVAAAMVLEAAGLLPYAVTTPLVVLSGVFMCAYAARFALKGFRPALYFTLSYFALLSGVALEWLAFLYPVALDPEPSVWTVFVGVQQNWSFHLGICAETVLISFAITYFIKDMKADVEGARAEIDKIKGEYESRLSALALKVGVRERIAEKTAALFAAKSTDERFLEAATRIVYEHIADENLGVGWLAGEMAVSKPTLRRRLARATGLGPLAFIRRQRLERAKYLLETHAFETVAEVAHAVGIANPGYFARLYRDTFGRTPGEVLKTAVRN